VYLAVDLFRLDWLFLLDYTFHLSFVLCISPPPTVGHGN
jgi:hypothetical protein